MKRTFCLISIVALLAFSCQTHRSNKSLAEVDSLVVAELYDSAYHMVNTMIEPSGLSPEEQAHCDLLRVQTSMLVNKPIESADSILNGVMSYYNQHVNHERLADIGHKNDSFNDIISKLLDNYEEYQQIKDLIEADKEFANGDGVH